MIIIIFEYSVYILNISSKTNFKSVKYYVIIVNFQLNEPTIIRAE